MSDIINYTGKGKRINELVILSEQLLDEALLAISQDSLTRSIPVGNIRDYFAFNNSDTRSRADNFYTVKDINEKIAGINDSFSSVGVRIGALEGQMEEFKAELDADILEINTTLNDFTDRRFIEFQTTITGDITRMGEEIDSFKTEVKDDFAQFQTDIEGELADAKVKLNEDILKVNADVNYIYGYGPTVPTLLPEGKIFLQTFNKNMTLPDANDYTINVGTDSDPAYITVRIKAEGMKIARITLIYPQLGDRNPDIAVTVTLKDKYALDSKGLQIYNGSLHDFSYTAGVGKYKDLGIFMIPTTATTIEVSTDAGIGGSLLNGTFTHDELGIWEAVGGVLTVSLMTGVEYNLDGSVAEASAFFYNEDGDFLSAEGSSDMNPAGAETPPIG